MLEMKSSPKYVCMCVFLLLSQLSASFRNVSFKIVQVTWPLNESLGVCGALWFRFPRV